MMSNQPLTRSAGIQGIQCISDLLVIFPFSLASCQRQKQLQRSNGRVKMPGAILFLRAQEGVWGPSVASLR